MRLSATRSGVSGEVPPPPSSGGRGSRSGNAPVVAVGGKLGELAGVDELAPGAGLNLGRGVGLAERDHRVAELEDCPDAQGAQRALKDAELHGVAVGQVQATVTLAVLTFALGRVLELLEHFLGAVLAAGVVAVVLAAIMLRRPVAPGKLDKLGREFVHEHKELSAYHVAGVVGHAQGGTAHVYVNARMLAVVGPDVQGVQGGAELIPGEPVAGGLQGARLGDDFKAAHGAVALHVAQALARHDVPDVAGYRVAVKRAKVCVGFKLHPVESPGARVGDLGQGAVLLETRELERRTVGGVIGADAPDMLRSTGEAGGDGLRVEGAGRNVRVRHGFYLLLVVGHDPIYGRDYWLPWAIVKALIRAPFRSPFSCPCVHCLHVGLVPLSRCDVRRGSRAVCIIRCRFPPAVPGSRVDGLSLIRSLSPFLIRAYPFGFQGAYLGGSVGQCLTRR